MATEFYADELVTLLHGDCVEVMAGMDAESVDAIVTDPPYGLEFMGKEWDNPTMLGSFQTAHHQRVGDGDGFGRYPAGEKRPGYVVGQSSQMQEWHTRWATEAYRVAKPGAHLLAFGGTRTYHRLASAIEDAGWEIRDCLVWAYASGFPKSLDVSKAIDKVNGETDRLHRFTAWMRTTKLTARQIDELTGTNMGGHYLTSRSQPAIPTPELWAKIRPLCGYVPPWVDELVDRIEAEREVIGERDVPDARVAPPQFYAMGSEDGQSAPSRTIDVTAPATDAAKRWQGWGTALKPAWEPIVMARKPLIGTVAANVTAHGTGALNIDGTRIGVGKDVPASPSRPERTTNSGYGYGEHDVNGDGFNPNIGRWPPNLLLTDPLFDGGVDGVVGGGPAGGSGPASGPTWSGPSGSPSRAAFNGMGDREPQFYGDTGTYSRFFLIPKAARSDREPLVRGELLLGGTGLYDDDGYRAPGETRGNHTARGPRANVHPTVKPVELMRHLVRLVTPPGGIVLDCFLGSGTTAIAANMEGFRCIGIEREAEYLEIAKARMLHQKVGMGL